MRYGWGRCLTAVSIALGVGAAAAAEELTGSLQIKGSDTMVNLAQAWAEEFMAIHPQVTVAVTGGGSGTGVAALIGGTCDLAATSRKMSPKEITKATAKGVAPKEWIAALDGIAVVVHPSNPVKRLTIEQLAGIFTGTIRNWKDVGGDDAGILLLSREVNSGTHVFFKEHVLGKDASGHDREFSQEALLLPSSQAIADEVAANATAIGYYGMGYANPQNAVVGVGTSAAGPFVAPSEASVRSGAYPIARPLLFYTRGGPEGLAKAFLDYVLSPEGQAVVRRIDFVPIAPAS
ncbi:MAG: phosphate ABC transporter substrate-binding protein [Candidatus Omnitrophica bacterium]|nr:phosphate ABC transporter substrate-binding protein [Candidatus Omnitrophota bacterium]